MGLETPLQAKKAFDRLRNTGSKRKCALKKASRSGNGGPKAATARAKLDELDYFAWIDDFSCVRQGQTNIPGGDNFM